MYHRFDPWEDTRDKYADVEKVTEDFLYHKGDEDKHEDYHKHELYKTDEEDELYTGRKEEEEKKEKELKDNIDKKVEQEEKYKKEEEREEEEKKEEEFFDQGMIQEQIEGIKERKKEEKKKESLKSVEELILEMSRKKEKEVINLDKK